MSTVTTYERIRTRAAEVCEERRIRPSEQPDAARGLIEELVREHQTSSVSGPYPASARQMRSTI